MPRRIGLGVPLDAVHAQGQLFLVHSTKRLFTGPLSVPYLVNLSICDIVNICRGDKNSIGMLLL